MIRLFQLKSALARHTFTLMTGSALAQVIPLVLTPIITRLYLPEMFGVVAVFTSIAGILAVLATARYNIAIVLPQKDEDGFRLLILSLACTVGLVVVLVAVYLPLHRHIARWLQYSQVVDYLFLIPLSVLILGTTQSLNGWFTRTKRFRSIAQSTVSNATVASTTKIGLGYAEIGAGGLVAGQVAGQAVSAGLLTCRAWKQDRSFLSCVTPSELKRLAREYVNFPRFDLANALFHIFSDRGIVLLLSALYGFASVGFLSLTERLILMPFSLFITSFSQVFYQRIAAEYHAQRENFGPLIRTMLHKFVRWLSLPFLILVFTSKYYVPFLLGEKWTELYRYIYVISPLIYIRLISSPVSHSFRILNKQHISLLLNFLLFAARFGAVGIGYFLFSWNILQTLFLYSVVGFLVQFFNIWYTLHRSDAGRVPILFLILAVLMVLYTGIGIPLFRT